MSNSTPRLDIGGAPTQDLGFAGWISSTAQGYRRQLAGSQAVRPAWRRLRTSRRTAPEGTPGRWDYSDLEALRSGSPRVFDSTTSALRRGIGATSTWGHCVRGSQLTDMVLRRGIGAAFRCVVALVLGSLAATLALSGSLSGASTRSELQCLQRSTRYPLLHGIFAPLADPVATAGDTPQKGTRF